MIGSINYLRIVYIDDDLNIEDKKVCDGNCSVFFANLKCGDGCND